MSEDWNDARHRALIAEALDLLASREMDRVDPFRSGLSRYLEFRLETGGFLRRVLENDLCGALAHAHPTVSLRQFHALAVLLNSVFPAEAWGSPAKVAAWLGEDK